MSHYLLCCLCKVDVNVNLVLFYPFPFINFVYDHPPSLTIDSSRPAAFNCGPVVVARLNQARLPMAWRVAVCNQ